MLHNDPVIGSFTFHSGTTSARDGTEISTIECADPGWCVQARCAPFKQIFWTGIGNFHRKDFAADLPCADAYKKQPSLHFYRAMVGDFGENDSPTREDTLVDENPETCDWFAKLQAAGWPGPPGPYDASDAVFLDSMPDDQFGYKGGEIQLTDVTARLLLDDSVYVCKFHDVEYDYAALPNFVTSIKPVFCTQWARCL